MFISISHLENKGSRRVQNCVLNFLKSFLVFYKDPSYWWSQRTTGQHYVQFAIEICPLYSRGQAFRELSSLKIETKTSFGHKIPNSHTKIVITVITFSPHLSKFPFNERDNYYYDGRPLIILFESKQNVSGWNSLPAILAIWSQVFDKITIINYFGSLTFFGWDDENV